MPSIVGRARFESLALANVESDAVVAALVTTLLPWSSLRLSATTHRYPGGY